jgi:hypothetical protein
MEILKTEKLELLEEEVLQTNNRILAICKKDEKLKKIYKGYIISLTHLFQNPDVLILGINPESEYFKTSKKILQKFIPIRLPYFVYDPRKQLKDCFTKIGMNNFLENAVVTNYYFFHTANEKELDVFFNMLPIEFRHEILSKAESWTKTIITEISPKNILCAGFRSTNELKRLYPEYKCIERGKNTEAAKINDITIISFEWLFSRIKNRNELKKYLDKYMNNNNE